VKHQRSGFLKLVQALSVNQPVKVQVNATFAGDFQHGVNVPARQKAGLLRRQPFRRKGPMYRRDYSLHVYLFRWEL